MARTKLHISTCLMAVLLGTLISFSALMCLVEAFSLRCSVPALAVVCAAASLVMTCTMLPAKAWLSSLAVLALWIGWIVWMRQPIGESLMALANAISEEYADCFAGVTVVGQYGDCLLILAVMAMPLCWLTVWTVCKEGSLLLLFLLCAPVLVICLIIVELAPIFWLILLTFSLLILLLSHSVRERNVKEGSRLAWWLLLPAVILVGAVTIIWPPADYERTDWAQAMQEVAESGFRKETLQELGQSAISFIPVGAIQQEKVDLSRLGPMRLTGRAVMNCLWAEPQFYLRGKSYGVYEDNQWSSLDADTYNAVMHQTEPLRAVGTMGYVSNLQIRTNRVEEVLYTTYYLQFVPEGAEFVRDAYIHNTGRLQEYDVHCSTGAATGGGTSGEYDDYVNYYYTQVPEELHAGLEEFLAQKGWDGTKDPELLAQMVRGSGVYDLNTPRLPVGEEFVLYFLQESNRGYCVHFATAATMLLRTAGIPARYVTGYSVSGNGTEWVEVTEDDAHAWVEYYVDHVGWLPLDPTPAADDSAVTTETDQEQPQQQGNQIPNNAPEQQPALPDEEKLQTPQQEAPAEQEEQRSVGSFWWMLVIPVFAALVLLRRWLILQGRNRRFHGRLPNRQALALWRWLVALGKKSGSYPEEDLFRLAEKARFSQHTLTEEELGMLRQAAELRIEKLKQLPALRRFWLRFGLVLY